MDGVPERLQALVNALLFSRLLQGEPRFMRAFKVSIEGSRVTSTLCTVSGSVEETLRRTPQGKAAIVPCG